MSLCLKRRSTRNFIDSPVHDDVIDQLLMSAMQAPSAKNQQPWEFMVIKNREVLDRLSEVSNGARHLKKAPIAIITLMRDTKTSPYMRPVDMAAATQNILIEATEQNLGSLWIGVYPLDERIDNIKKIVTIDETLTPFSIVALGYPENPNVEIKPRFDRNRVKVIE